MQAYRSGKVTGLSETDKKAIDDGADLNQVVNARRGIYTASGRTLTREGRSRFGVRPTPEQLYRDATSRTEAVEFLRRFGYII